MTAACRTSRCRHYYGDNAATLTQFMQEGFARHTPPGIHWLPSHWAPTLVDESWREHAVSRRDGQWVDGWYQWEDRSGWFTRLRWEPAS